MRKNIFRKERPINNIVACRALRRGLEPEAEE
jgi:hypothetical protein